jgi:2-polyprenyl-3-methyl-5-hydroxy-6-metoxy-1,4-benzoquinol methylase
VLGEFNAAHPWDHNAHYHRWILRRLPRRFGTALDVGCGTGGLARLLTTRAEAVYGIDVDAGLIARARELTDPGTSVTFAMGDALADTAPGRYEVITCVATLHHLPFAEALDHFRGQLAPGGTLVVLGISRLQGLGDQLLGAVAIPANVVMGCVKNRGRSGTRPVAMTAPVREATMTFREIVRETHHILPGARLRRRLFWRYTLTWRNL